MGWVRQASPVHSLPALAAQLGLRELWIKRDDKLSAFGGGNKVRKLDTLLAQPAYQDVSDWHSSGAIGSGQLIVGAQIARSLGKNFIAHACGQPFSPDAMRTLGILQASATQVIRYRSRASMALTCPQLVTRKRWRGGAIIPPGATSPHGNLGFVRAGLELAEQIRKGDLPKPDGIYLPLGSGGTAVGLAIGLALSEIPIPVHAISIVEPVFVNRVRIAGIVRRLRAHLQAGGIDPPRSKTLALVIDTSCVGPGYAHASLASEEACARLRDFGLTLDPSYTGKAMAALLRDATADARGGKLLFWNTGR